MSDGVSGLTALSTALGLWSVSSEHGFKNVICNSIIPDISVYDWITVPDSSVYDWITVPDSSVYDWITVPDSSVYDWITVPDSSVYDSACLLICEASRSCSRMLQFHQHSAPTPKPQGEPTCV
ncbi:hypothetical protein BsWGS_27400 [Bradybaena similaris]